jgi:hypothetical protein
MHGSDVRMLQALLTKAGFVTVADGYYGRRTRRSVGRWEGDRERKVNGTMSRPDQLALRREFKAPIAPAGPEVESATGVTKLVLLDATASSGVPQPEHSILFPIAGQHDLGRNEANRFGGGRGHLGQDMFADCGTPDRAAQGGRVEFSGYQGAAGNYLVIRSEESGEDQVDMHLLHEPRLAVGDGDEAGLREQGLEHPHVAAVHAHPQRAVAERRRCGGGDRKRQQQRAQRAAGQTGQGRASLSGAYGVS